MSGRPGTVNGSGPFCLLFVVCCLFVVGLLVWGFRRDWAWYAGFAAWNQNGMFGHPHFRTNLPWFCLKVGVGRLRALGSGVGMGLALGWRPRFRTGLRWFCLKTGMGRLRALGSGVGMGLALGWRPRFRTDLRWICLKTGMGRLHAMC